MRQGLSRETESPQPRRQDMSCFGAPEDRCSDLHIGFRDNVSGLEMLASAIARKLVVKESVSSKCPTLMFACSFKCYPTFPALRCAVLDAVKESLKHKMLLFAYVEALA